MSNERKRIQDQLERAIVRDAWHGPSFDEAAAEYDGHTAARTLSPDGHTACEIALHIAVWLEVAATRLKGTAFSPTDAQDWPRPISSDEQAWSAAVDRVHAAHQGLKSAIAALSDDDALSARVAGQRYDAYVLLHGAIQHTLYHTGQLVLMNRTLSA